MEDDILNPPTKKPLFKRKQVKGGKSQRKVRDHEGMELDEDLNADSSNDHELNWKSTIPKPSRNPKPFIRNSTKVSDISKWKVKNSDDEIGDISKFNEGDILTNLELEDDQQPQIKKYVPKLEGEDVNPSQKHILNELTNEYGEDNEDFDNIETNYATIDAEPIDDLIMNNDDSIAETEPINAPKIDQDKYDMQLSDSEDEADIIKIIEPLTISQELDRLAKLLTSTKLEEQSKKNELDINKQRLLDLESKRVSLLDSL